jgi:hypothetical protein
LAGIRLPRTPSQGQRGSSLEKRNAQKSECCRRECYSSRVSDCAVKPLSTRNRKEGSGISSNNAIDICCMPRTPDMRLQMRGLANSNAIEGILQGRTSRASQSMGDDQELETYRGGVLRRGSRHITRAICISSSSKGDDRELETCRGGVRRGSRHITRAVCISSSSKGDDRELETYTGGILRRGSRHITVNNHRSDLHFVVGNKIRLRHAIILSTVSR